MKNVMVGLGVALVTLIMVFLLYSSTLMADMVELERQRYSEATEKYYEMCEQHNTKEFCFYNWER